MRNCANILGNGTLARERAEQLVQADRMVTLGTMAAGIAHEINNPLTVVQGNIKLIKRVWTQDVNQVFQEAEKCRKFVIGSQAIMELLASLEKSSVRMRNIIDGMRQLRARQRGEISVIVPGVCVQDALEFASPKPKPASRCLRKSPISPGGERQCRTDNQVLVNFIGNAADALAGTSGPKLPSRGWQ